MNVCHQKIIIVMKKQHVQILKEVIIVFVFKVIQEMELIVQVFFFFFFPFFCFEC